MAESYSDVEKWEFLLEFNGPFSYGSNYEKQLSVSCGYLQATVKVSEPEGCRPWCSVNVDISFQETKKGGKVLCAIRACYSNSVERSFPKSPALLSCSCKYCNIKFVVFHLNNLKRIFIHVREILNGSATQNASSQTELSKINDGTIRIAYELQSYGVDLFKSEKFSDIIINVQGNKFPAHRIILSAMSPVFETMLTGNFKENATKEVEIENFNLRTISEMVRFVYTGEMPRSESDVCIRDLYAASDCYDVKELKRLCKQELMSTLNVANALDVLLLAEMHNDDQLKKCVLAFICKNPSSVSDKKKCAQVIKKRPELLEDILECKFN